MTTFISQNFTLEEATQSQTASRLGIDNSHPDATVMDAAIKTATRMEKVRAVLHDRPININSWIRNLALNTAIGSKPTSSHIKGEAVDFICPAFGSPADICKELLRFKDLVRWDRLILEHTWVHISWNSLPNAVQRRDVLSLLSTGHYSQGLTDSAGVPLPT